MMNQCLQSRKRCQCPTKIATCDQPVSVKNAVGVFTGGFPRQTEQRWTKPERKVSPFPLCGSILVPSENKGNNSGLLHVILFSILTGRDNPCLTFAPSVRCGIRVQILWQDMQQYKPKTVKMSNYLFHYNYCAVLLPSFFPPPWFLTLWITEITEHPLDSNPNPPSPANATCVCLSSLGWWTVCCGDTIFSPFGDCKNAQR